MQQALSVSNPMLLVMENDGSDTYRSAQGGAMHLGEAVFMRWRNVLGHEPGGSDRQAAIEALASVSALARMSGAVFRRREPKTAAISGNQRFW